MKEITLWILDKILPIIPGLILRLFYSPKKVASQIRVNLKGERPIAPSLSSTIPHIDIYLEVTNLSNLDLRLDRMLLDLWVGQPLLLGAMLESLQVSPKSAGQQVFFRSFLSSKQVQQVELFSSEPLPGGSITLSVTAYFESKVGIVEFQERFERRKF